MTQAATFGRRGTITAPPPARTGQSRPAAKAAAPAAPKRRDDSLGGYFLWLLFSFNHRLDRRTYRYARMIANGGFTVAVWSLNAQIPKFAGNAGMELLVVLTLLAMIVVMAWTTLAMQVKRRHDRDKAWPWLLVGFIPVLGPIWVLVETCWLDGTPGYNRFDDPAKAAAATFA